MNYYPHHIGDYLRDTSHLSLLEHGAYRRMLDLYYASEKPLPLDNDGLCRLIQAKSKLERDAVATVLQEFFLRSQDGWRNARADLEIIKAQEKSGKAKASAAHRWQSERIPADDADVMRTHSEGNAPNNQEPRANTKSQEPAAKAKEEKPSPGVEKPTPRRVNGHEAPTVETWNAYATAYQHRWGVEPTRNKTVNGQLSQFITRVPAAEAPEIASFYVGSSRGLYVAAKHPTNLLLRDAEALRTEWLTGKQGTETEARQADRAQSTGNAFAPLIAEAAARERLPDASK